MRSSSLLLLLLPTLATAHMAITIVPPGGAAHECRSNPTAGDTRRNPNSNRCHDTSFSTTNDLITLNAGDTVQAPLTFGAGHNGGHSVWTISTDDTTYYKFQDEVDLTAGAASGGSFVVPSNAPSACAAAGCTLSWFWTPVSSGGCEVYQNCFNVKITGAAGGMESSAPSISTNPTNPIISNCVRVDPTTHLTPHFAGLSDEGTEGGESAGPVPGQEVEGDCVTYTVQSGDTLSAIADTYDVDGGYQAIFEANKDVLVSADSIEIGMKLVIPGSDCDSSKKKNAGGLGGGGIAGIVLSLFGVSMFAGFMLKQKIKSGKHALKGGKDNEMI